METSKKVYLIDLDGTLLKPISIFFLLGNVFFIIKNFFPIFGYKVFSKVTKSLKDMFNHSEPGKTNLQVLTASLRDKTSLDIEKSLWNFYQNDFKKLRIFCRPVPEAARALQLISTRGNKIYLATNPIWPEECVRLRLQWAGVPVEIFSGMTHSQNWHSCKPHLRYYKEILDTWKLNTSDCLLIGDNIKKEGPASLLGIEVVILNSKNGPQFWNQLAQTMH